MFTSDPFSSLLLTRTVFGPDTGTGNSGIRLKRQIKIHLPSSTPDQAIFGMLLDRVPRLVT